MSWNYRIMKHNEISCLEPWYGIHEVFYGEGNVVSWAEDEILSADSPDDLIADVEMMLSDIKKYKDDILDY